MSWSGSYLSHWTASASGIGGEATSGDSWRTRVSSVGLGIGGGGSGSSDGESAGGDDLSGVKPGVVELVFFVRLGERGHGRCWGSDSGGVSRSVGLDLLAPAALDLFLECGETPLHVVEPLEIVEEKSGGAGPLLSLLERRRGDDA